MSDDVFCHQTQIVTVMDRNVDRQNDRSRSNSTQRTCMQCFIR